MKSSSPVTREIGALFALLTAFVWLAYVLTRPSNVTNWIVHPATAAGLWLFLFSFRQETLVRRGIWLALVLIGLWILKRTSMVWVPFVMAGGFAYVGRFFSRAFQEIPLPGRRVLRLPRVVAHGVLGLLVVVSGGFLGLGVVPNLVRQVGQLAEGIGVAYREAFLPRIEIVRLEALIPQGEQPDRLGGTVSAGAQKWNEGEALTPEVFLEMRRAGVLEVPLRREPLLEEWLRNATWLHSVRDFLERVLGPDYMGTLRETFQEKLGTLSGGASAVVGWVFEVSGRFLSGVFHGLLIGVLTLVILAYGAPALDRYVEGFFSLFPPDRRERARLVARQIDHDLQAFLRGQLVVVVAVATLSTFVYALGGIPFPLVVGVMGGLLNTIPNVGVLLVGIGALGALVFGTALGVEPPILFVLSAEGFHGFLLRAALIPVAVEVVQLVDNSFISPRVMSHALRMDPLLMMGAVLLGGTLFGFWGVLFAVPALVVLRATWSALRE